MVFVDVKHHIYFTLRKTELRKCVEVEVAVLGSSTIIFLMVSVKVKQH